MEKVFRSRSFGLVLYKDSTDYNYNQVIDFIEKNYLKYAYIEHLPEEEDKKPHTHIVIYFNNKKYNTSLSKELNVPINYIQEVHLKPYLKYLIHYDNEDKIQYTLNDVIGPLKYELEDLISDKTTEKEDFEMLVDFINNFDGKLSFSVLTKYVLKCNFYSCYRRNINALRILINEHNNVY